MTVETMIWHAIVSARGSCLFTLSFGRCATGAWTCSIFRTQPLLKKEQGRRRLSTRVKWLKRFVVGHGHVSPHGETGAR